MAAELNTDAIVKRQTRVVKNLWYAAAGTVFIYVVIPHLIPPFQGSPDLTAFSLRLRFILWAVALVELAILLWWKQRMLAPDRLISAAHDNLTVALGHYVGKNAATFSMANSIAVYGLALALVGRYFWDQTILTFISLVLLFYLYPPVRWQT